MRSGASSDAPGEVGPGVAAEGLAAGLPAGPPGAGARLARSFPGRVAEGPGPAHDWAAAAAIANAPASANARTLKR
jgi:hypothetical protein